MQSIQASNRSSVNPFNFKKAAVGILSTVGAISVLNTISSSVQIKSHVSLRGAVTKPSVLHNIDVLKNSNSVHSLSLSNTQNNSHRKLTEVARQLSTYNEAHKGECDDAAVNELCVPILAWTGKLMHVAEESKSGKELLATLQEGKTLLTSLNKLLPADSELSDILKNVNNLLTSLESTLVVVNNTAKEIGKVSAKIGTTSDKISNTSEKIGATSDKVGGTSDAVTVASIAVFLAAVAVTAAAVSVLRTSQTANQSMHTANKTMDTANQTIAEVNTLVNRVNENLLSEEALQNSSQVLDNITKITDGLSRLTDLGVRTIGVHPTQVSEDQLPAVALNLRTNIQQSFAAAATALENTSQTLQTGNTILAPAHYVVESGASVLNRIAQMWRGNAAPLAPAMPARPAHENNAEQQV